jgi:hypothetical protein
MYLVDTNIFLEPLLGHFGSVGAIFRATDKALMEVRGLGRKWWKKSGMCWKRSSVELILFPKECTLQ